MYDLQNSISNLLLELYLNGSNKVTVADGFFDNGIIIHKAEADDIFTEFVDIEDYEVVSITWTTDSGETGEIDLEDENEVNDYKEELISELEELQSR